MTLTSAMLREQYDVISPDLHRWVRYGWLTPEPGPRGSGFPFRWPGWVARMVAVLAAPHERDRRRAITARGHRPGSPLTVYCDQMEALAEALSVDPDAPWYVYVDGEMWPAWSAREAVEAMMLDPGQVGCIVSPPAY